MQTASQAQTKEIDFSFLKDIVTKKEMLRV